ncbi:hypothetical protein QOZ80_2AG0136020 [Eleusine coracana subsp. coracana]|nr:hypothetical protein QOZ80_2AG0136020 [Eleusine coracana subsp. coracana]
MSDWNPRASDWTSKPFGFGSQPEARDVTFKVKYGDTLKRFYGAANDMTLDINLSALRVKIANAFKFGPDAEFILTYTDEDGDAVMLDDDDDLRDAALHQKLNPLRINVQLKSSHATEQQQNTESVKPTAQDTVSQIMSAIEALKPVSKSSTAPEECLAQIKSAVGEAIKSIPEPIPDALAKLSHEVLDSAPPPFAELIKPLVQLITPSNNSNGSSSSSSGMTQTQTRMQTAAANDEPRVSANSISRELTDEKGHKSVIDEVAMAASAAGIAPLPPSAVASQGQQSSLYPPVEDLLFSSNSIDKSLNNGKSDAQSKGKAVMSSTAQPTPPAIPTLAPHMPPSISEWFQPRRCHSDRWQYEASRWRAPMQNVPGWPPASLPQAPPGYGSSPHFPYPGRLLSSGRVYGDLGNKIEKSAERCLHKWIKCDGCGVQPIAGPRYKSNVREDYDLCDSCFKHMGNEAEYSKIDKPVVHRLSRDPNVHRKVHPRVLMKSKREKLESRFILDVTVLDGTLMAPSTQFTKIWRMHNNGTIMWPLGTQLIWVGGDHFALQTSVPLEILVNGFPVDKEIDVAVDFVAPARPGRYISYWRLASPSGQKFGQRVWVHIQVEDPSFVNGKNKSAINLNLPPESNSSNMNLIDANMEPFTSTQGYNSYPVGMSNTFEPKKSQPAPFAFEPQKSQPAPFTFIIPDVADVPLSTTPITAVSPSASVPTSEPVLSAVPLPVSMPNMTETTPVANRPASPAASVEVLAPVSVSASVSDAAAPEPGIDGDTEEKLLKELEEMGFKQVDLNKEILRQNNYNLEQSVDDLCGVNEWDPLLAELEEMGFDDTEMNKELLAKNGGSIKRAVMDLIAREKKDK